MKAVIKNYRGITHRQFMNAIEKYSCRDSFSGIFADLENKVFVGTDGHQLIRYPFEIVSSEKIDFEKFRKVLPLDLFKITQYKIPKKDFGEIEYILHDDKVEARYKNFSCEMKYVTDNFPNYNHVLPNEETINEHNETIRISSTSIQKLFRAIPDIRFDMTHYGHKKPIYFKEIVPQEERPITAILMPFSRNLP